MKKTEILNKLRELIEENADLKQKNSELSVKVAELKARLKNVAETAPQGEKAEAQPQPEPDGYAEPAVTVKILPNREEEEKSASVPELQPAEPQELQQNFISDNDRDFNSEAAVLSEQSADDNDDTETAETENKLTEQPPVSTVAATAPAASADAENDELFAAPVAESGTYGLENCGIDDGIADIAASFVGRAVIAVTEFTDEICSSGSENAKELVTLALGKAEVFKSETVENAENAVSAETFSKQCAAEFEKLQRYINTLRLSV